MKMSYMPGILSGPMGPTVDLTPLTTMIELRLNAIESRLDKIEESKNLRPIDFVNYSEVLKKEDKPTNENLYKHYKGNTYELLMIANNSEVPTERLVIYQDVESKKIWARPYEMFYERIFHNGEYVERFKKL